MSIKQKNTGKRFEALTAEVVRMLAVDEKNAIVETDVKLKSFDTDGNRQIDVLMRTEVAGGSLSVAFECRDYGRKQNPSHVGEFWDKMREVGVTKGFMVSRVGFTKKAIQKAHRHQITLCTLETAATKIRTAAYNFPVVVSQVKSLNVSVNYTAYMNGGQSIQVQDMFSFNGRDLNSIVLNDLQSRPRDQCVVSREFEVDLTLHRHRVVVRDVTGAEIIATNVRLRYTPELVHHFGYVSDLQSAKTLIYEAEKKAITVFDVSELLNANERFAAYDEIRDVPSVSATRIELIAVPQIVIKPEHVQMRRVGSV